MLDTLRKCLHLLPRPSRLHYLLLLPLSLVTGLVEMGAAVGLFAVITVLTDPPTGLAIGWVAALARVLPWQGQAALVIQLAGLLALYYILRSGLLLGTQYYRIRVAHAANAELSCEMLRRYLSAAYPFHFGRHSADLMRNCTASVAQSLGVLAAGGGLLTDGVMAVGMLSVLIATSPKLSLATAIVLVGAILLTLRVTRKAVLKRGQAQHELGASMLRSLQQALGGVKELKVLGRERYFSDEFAARQRDALAISYLSAAIDSVPAVALQTVLVCGGLALVATLTASGLTGLETLPIAAVFGYVGLRLLPMANGVVATLNHIRSSRAAVDELYTDFNALATVNDTPDTPHLEFTDSIILDAVSFTYPSAATPAIEDVSITIRRGESIGIIGPTGAGKSTLVDVILGLLPPTRGRVVVDGRALSSTSVPWKRRVGYVPQAIYLIDDTLQRNIALGIPDEEIDQERIRAAVTAAQLDRFVGSLPQGLRTLVGERGVRLSGGERQRLAIARALYHDPDVLIFDEATASLDVQTEADITRTITALHDVKTVIVIAHRLSSVKACDRLVWLTAGRVVDVGSFGELQQRRTDFRALVELAAV